MFSYIVRDDKSSVYHALVETISRRSHWTQKTGDTVKANLIIGERNTVKFPFGRLGNVVCRSMFEPRIGLLR